MLSSNLYLVGVNNKSLPKNETIILIKPGMGLNKIAQELYDNNIIKYKFLFTSWVKFNSMSKNLKAGEYRIKNNSSIIDIFSYLHKGKSVIRFYQVPEGSTQYSLKQDLLKKIKDDNKYFIIPKNLIADTYGYNYNDSIKKIIKNIESYSKKTSVEIWNTRDKEIPLQSVDDLFIIASIIEKETSKNSEKQTIAGVFYNRIKNNMRLQSDPTVIYAISKGKVFNRLLTRKDTKFKSEFNTYYIKGLPPSPICFPSFASLYAAANPKKNKFFYFVADGKGGHFFSKNYKGHLKKIKMLKKNDK